MCVLCTRGHSIRKKLPQNYMYAGQGATVGTELGTTNCSILGKEYVKAVYHHLAYLTYMQSTSCKMTGWIKKAQVGIKIAGRNINNLKYADDTT